MLTDHRLAVVVALGMTQTLAWASSYYLPAILARPMAATFGISEGWIFGAFSAALVMSALLGPWAGRRIDRRGGRGILMLSSLVFALGLVVLGTAVGPMMLVVGWLILGVGMAVGLYEAAFATLTRIYGSGARGPITGITLLAGLASTVGWPVTAGLEASIDWRVACFAWAGAHILLGLPVNRFLVPLPKADLAPPSGEPAGSSGTAGEDVSCGADPLAREQRRAMLLLAVAFTFTLFIASAMGAHLPRLLMDAGTSEAAAIAAASLMGPAQVVARLLEFGLLRHFHPLVAARLAALAHPVGAVSVLVVGAPAAPVLAALHGGGNGIMTIARGTVPLALFGPAGYGVRQGYLNVPARFGQAGAPLIFAILIEMFGSAALLVSAACGLGMLAALLALNPQSARPSQSDR